MKVTVTTDSDVMFTLDVGEDLDLGSFKGLCEAEAGIPPENILLILNGRPLVNDNKSLKDLGIVDNDVVMIHFDAASPPPQQSPSTSSGAAAVLDSDDDDPGSSSVVVAVHVEGEAEDGDPPLASTSAEDCVPSTSKGALHKEVKSEKSSETPKKTAAEKKDAISPESSGFFYDQLSFKDQVAFLQYFKENGFSKEELAYMKNFNPEFANTVIKAQMGIKAEPGGQVDADMELAIQLSIALMNDEAGAVGGSVEPGPTANYEFDQVHRPFVACQINGCDVTAFLSTKCKFSIISASCANKCRIMDRVQQSEAGRPNIAGAANLKYYGYIEVVIEMSGEPMGSIFHVFGGMETEVVIGLDWLHEWQCEISFAQESLWISLNGARVPFIPEPLPDKQKSWIDAEEEPKVRKSRGRGRPPKE